MVSADDLQKKLTGSSLAPEHVSIVDTSDGCGSKFEAIVVSKAFEGVQLLERHRLVNTTLSDEMTTIHAFSMKCWTPEQYEKKKGS